jgi:hypothetical protein
MFRALYFLLVTAMIVMPATASAEASCTGEATHVTRSIEERSEKGSNRAVLCPEFVGLGTMEERARRLVSELFERVAGMFDWTELAVLPDSGYQRCNCGENVVQSFRAAGVRLLTFGTAPPEA